MISVLVISHITDVVVHMPLFLHVLFTRDVPKANCLTQGLEPMSSPLPSLLQNVQNIVLNPQPNVQPAAQPAAGQPIPLAPVEHVQPLKVKYSCIKKWKAGHLCHGVELASQADVVFFSSTDLQYFCFPLRNAGFGEVLRRYIAYLKVRRATDNSGNIRVQLEFCNLPPSTTRTQVYPDDSVVVERIVLPACGHKPGYWPWGPNASRPYY